MAKRVKQLTPLEPTDASQSAIDSDTRQQEISLSAYSRAEARGFALPVVQMNKGRHVGVERAAAVSGVDSSPPPLAGAGEQAAYVATVRRFLDASRVYLASSERIEPHAGVCALPSAVRHHPAQQFQIGGEYVVR